jgi:Ca2+-binding EF-hand superfamily protein
VRISAGAQLVAFRSGQITPEQYKEIKETFEYFDLDKDNTLDRKEFHSCATGIGVMLKEDEVNSVFEALDTSGVGHIGIEQFVPFMVKTLTGVCGAGLRGRRL